MFWPFDSNFFKNVSETFSFVGSLARSLAMLAQQNIQRLKVIWQVHSVVFPSDGGPQSDTTFLDGLDISRTSG